MCFFFYLFSMLNFWKFLSAYDIYVNLVMVSGRISILLIPDSVVSSERRIRLNITCRRRSLWMG
jgi:hypothetical protein